MSKVDDAIAEIDAALADIAPKHEGLRDYAALDLKAETLDNVQRAITQYDRRVLHLTTTREQLRLLVADGHPPLTIPDVSASVLADLQENAETIEAALAQFRSNAASTLGLNPAPPEPK